MTYIFGPEAEYEMNSAKNGLFLPRVIEEAFDKYQLVIAPADADSKPREWKFLVLDRSGLWNVEAVPRTTFGKLHQSRLRFPDRIAFRPRARYLYFQYIMAML